MSIRKCPLVKNEIYHVYNSSVAHVPIFRNKRENNRFLELIEYYCFNNTKLRYSYYSRLPKYEKQNILDLLYKENQTFIDLFSFSLMPNHYHFLVRQNVEKGISEFIRRLQDSYAKYLNKKTKRSGGLFQSPFKAVRIENDLQLLHVSRYIHLNPLTSYILRDEIQLTEYTYSSFSDYLRKPRRFVNTGIINSFFKKPEAFKKFTLDQVDYQRKLDIIKHLVVG